MKKALIIVLILSFFTKLSNAQNFTYGKNTAAEMDMSKYVNDTSAHAVVLQEFGESRMRVANDDYIKVFYTYHVKIKIFDNKGFDQGTVQIPVYNNSGDDSYENVYDIKGITTYKDDNGLIRQIELENKKIYPVKENKHWANYKFALPGLRNGCIVEYEYTIESPYWENFHSWQFQSDIPKINSEYDVHIPGFWNYNASLRGFLKLDKNTSEVERDCFSSAGAHCDCSFLTYGMHNVPAFIEEDAMTAPKNYRSAINFELVDYMSPYTGVKKRFTKEWKDVDYQLKTDPYFGRQLKRESLLKDKITPIIAGKTDDLSKAKAVYAYIQKWFKWNDYYGISCVDGLSKALDSHSGSVADINFSLIDALKAAGLKADAVILSTRENGSINNLYPVIGDFNYVIAKVDVGTGSYFLDATDPLLSFGTLPLKCLNGQGRVMSLEEPSYFIDLVTTQKQKSTYSMELTLQEDGKLKGTITNYSIGYQAYLKRKAIKKFNSTDEYVEDLNSRLPKLKILKSTISNLDSLDQPVGEVYEVEISLFDKVNNGNFTFNPFFLKRITENPFKMTDRLYPVDWGMASDERNILTVHLPKGYVVATPPQIVNIEMPNNGGRFLSSYEPLDNTFTFSNIIQFNKGVYSSGEYPYLKDLYNKIIQTEKGEMVFKKK
jgi:Domain of Unknown Function with PDB structure (DUF3857)